MSWIDELQIGDIVIMKNTYYTFLEIDEHGLYSLYSIPYKLSRYEIKTLCRKAI